jgi:hypothetical protein
LAFVFIRIDCGKVLIPSPPPPGSQVVMGVSVENKGVRWGVVFLYTSLYEDLRWEV